MSRRLFQLPGRARRDGQEPSAGALLTAQQHQLIEDELGLLERLTDTLDRFPAVAVFGTFIYAQRGRPDVADRWALAVENSLFDGVMPDGSSSLRPWAALVRALM